MMRKSQSSATFGGFECSACGRAIEGDTHTFVRHIIACRTGAVATPDEASASPSSGGKQQGQRVEVLAGASTERRDYVAEELSILRAMYADTVTVLYDDDPMRFPALTFDCSATISATSELMQRFASQQTEDSSDALDGSNGTSPTTAAAVVEALPTEAEARVFLTVEYTAGYPFAAPNIDVVEAVKGTMRRSAWDHVKRAIQQSVKAGLASQDPFLPDLIQAVQSALEGLSMALEVPETSSSRRPSSGLKHHHAIEFVYEKTTGSPAAGPEDAGIGALSPMHAPADFATTVATGHTQPRGGPRGQGHTPAAMTGSTHNSALNTPIHTAAKAPALAVAPLVAAGCGANYTSPEEAAELVKQRRMSELMCMHLLRRLCTSGHGADTLPQNAYDTIRVYLEDQGVVYDAKADAGHRMLRRVFKTAMDAARDPVLSWLWAPAEGDASAVADDDEGGTRSKAAASQLAQSRRFQREFVETAQLGAGGFGSVHACIRYVDRRKYAVKKVVMRRAKSAIVLREVRTLAALEHPNVVRYYDCWLEAGKHGDVVESDDDDEEEEEEDETSIVDSLNDRSSVATVDDDETSDAGGAPQTPTTAPPRAAAAAAAAVIQSQQRPTAHDIFGDCTDDEDDEEEEEEDEGGEVSAAASDSDDEASAVSSSSASTAAAAAADDGDDADRLLPPSGSRGDGRDFCTLYVQMELCQPTNLQDAIDEGRLKRREDVLYHVLRQLLTVLTFVHSRGAIHRDLKPANVLFDGASDDLLCDIKVADFGLARYLDDANAEPAEGEATSRQSSTAAIGRARAASVAADSRLTSGCGTLLYAAPEQVAGVFGADQHADAVAAAPYGAKVDEYSVGIIWFEMWLSAASTLDFRERREAIAALRRTATVPGWLRKTQPLAADVIEALVRHDPRFRASADEILALDALPGDPTEIAAALETISNHRDRMSDRIVQRLISTAKATKTTVPAAGTLPDHATQQVVRHFERIANQRNVRTIDAHQQMLPLGNMAPEAADAARCDIVLDRHGEPLLVLREPSLAVGAWFARHSRALAELGSAAVFRASCVHATDSAEVVNATFSVFGGGLAPGQRIAEAAAFASSLVALRETRPRRGGYVLRLYHPAIAAVTSALGLNLPTPDHDFSAAAPSNGVPLGPTELLEYPVRIVQLSDWTEVHRAATAALQNQPPAARAALDELDAVVSTLMAVRAPSDVPVEVHPFGSLTPRGHVPHLHRTHHTHSQGTSAVASPITESLGAPVDGVAAAAAGSNASAGANHVTGLHAMLLRYHDDGHATGVTRRHVDPASSKAKATSKLRASRKVQGLHGVPTAGRVFDIVGRIVCDPFVGALSTVASGGSPAPAAIGSATVSGGRLTVLTVCLSAVAKAAREPLPLVGCTVALSRGEGGRNAHGGNLVAGSDAERVLRAAKECWCANVRAEPLYRSERSEEAAATAAAAKHGVTHLLSLHPLNERNASPDSENYRVLRSGMSAREIGKLDLTASRISEVLTELMAESGTNDHGGVSGAAAAGHGGAATGHGGADGAGSSVAGGRGGADVARFSTFDVVGFTPPPGQLAEAKAKAMSAFAHYSRYCLPHRVVAVPSDTEVERVRHTIAEFTSAKNLNSKSPSSVPASLQFKPLYHWLAHNSKNMTSVAVYTPSGDSIDVVLNHRALAMSHQSSGVTRKKEDGKKGGKK